MSSVLTVEQREQAGSDSYNRFEYQVHWIVCHIIGKLQEDAESLLDILDDMSNSPDNPFKMSDIKVALKAYDNDDSVRWSPRMIQHWTDIQMRETKRNRRKQNTHLKMARSNRDILAEEKGKQNWWEGGGRPKGSIDTLESSKVAAQVEEWMMSHPNSHNKSVCARDLGLTRPTVRKWWNIIETQSENYFYKKFEEEINLDMMNSISQGAGIFDDENQIPHFN